jgi:NAD(P)-dependent dehydrogenase (short-subunit alcohol dehydrogenase family)
MNPKTLLITGCSSGFGRLTALHMARKGWRVFATVRKESDRQSLLAESAGKVDVLLCDIVDEAQVAALGRAVAAATPTLDALVNNAGTAMPSPLELLPPADLRAQFDLNVVAQLAVTQAVLPLLKAAKGTIINVSSISGRVTSPVTGPYSASKFALEALSDALRVELAPFGVRVVVIEPGSSPTAIWETSIRGAKARIAERQVDSGPYGPLIERVEKYARRRGANGFPPQLFADTVERILNSRNPRSRYPIPRQAAMLITVRKLLPDWLWDRIVRANLKW